MITLQLPYPPSLNMIYPTGKNGRRYLSDRGKSYKRDASKAIMVSMAGHTEKLPLRSRLYVFIDAIMPDRRARDIDNIVKIILDVCQDAGIYADDSQIDVLQIVRGRVQKPGSVRVRITE